MSMSIRAPARIWVMQTIPGYTVIWKNTFTRPPFRSELEPELRILMEEALGQRKG